MTKSEGSESEMDTSGASPKSVSHSANETNGVFLTVENERETSVARQRSSSPQEPPRSPYTRARSLRRSTTVETPHVTRVETEVWSIESTYLCLIINT